MEGSTAATGDDKDGTSGRFTLESNAELEPGSDGECKDMIPWPLNQGKAQAPGGAKKSGQWPVTPATGRVIRLSEGQPAMKVDNIKTGRKGMPSMTYRLSIGSRVLDLGHFLCCGYVYSSLAVCPHNNPSVSKGHGLFGEF